MKIPGEQACIELVQAHKGVWYPHIGVTVPEINPYLAQIQFYKHPAYYIMDPDKNFIELVEVRQ